MNKKIALFLLVLFSLAAYAPALRNGFVWDDQALILRDPLIRSWQLIPEGFTHFLFTDASASDFYRPLQRVTYTLDYAVFFLSPMGYHLVSLLWHAAAAVALFYFAEEFLATCKMEPARRLWVAFLAALVWALHPVQSAAVIYVAGRADPLAATFGFLGLYLALRMLRAERNREVGPWGWRRPLLSRQRAEQRDRSDLLARLADHRPCATSAPGIVRRGRFGRRRVDRLFEFASGGGTHSGAGRVAGSASR